jgi:hypothetical protein
MIGIRISMKSYHFHWGYCAVSQFRKIKIQMKSPILSGSPKQVVIEYTVVILISY